MYALNHSCCCISTLVSVVRKKNYESHRWLIDNCTFCIQLGSEYQTSSVFEWSKRTDAKWFSIQMPFEYWTDQPSKYWTDQPSKYWTNGSNHFLLTLPVFKWYVLSIAHRLIIWNPNFKNLGIQMIGIQTPHCSHLSPVKRFPWVMLKWQFNWRWAQCVLSLDSFIRGLLSWV